MGVGVGVGLDEDNSLLGSTMNGAGVEADGAAFLGAGGVFGVGSESSIREPVRG